MKNRGLIQPSITNQDEFPRDNRESKIQPTRIIEEKLSTDLELFEVKTSELSEAKYAGVNPLYRRLTRGDNAHFLGLTLLTILSSGMMCLLNLLFSEITYDPLVSQKSSDMAKYSGITFASVVTSVFIFDCLIRNRLRKHQTSYENNAESLVAIDEQTLSRIQEAAAHIPVPLAEIKTAGDYREMTLQVLKEFPKTKETRKKFFEINNQLNLFKNNKGVEKIVADYLGKPDAVKLDAFQSNKT